MASKTCSSLAIFLTLNILFFSLVSSCGTCGSSPYTKPNPKHKPHPKHSGGSSPSGGGPSPYGGSTPSAPSSGSTPSGGGSGPSGGSSSSGGSGSAVTCPRDALKLGVCANVLNGLLNITLGQPPVTPCCSLLEGLVDLEAAVCLCTALKANILGINLNLPISLSLLLNVCSKKAPRDFQCY